jgi:hypothetical protein
MSGESPYIDTRDVPKLLDCGRLGRQAADNPRSALCVVKSCRKRLLNSQGAAQAKAAALHPNGTRAHYLNYLQRGEGEAGKRSVGNRISQPIRSIEKVIDRRVEDRIDRSKQADES